MVFKRIPLALFCAAIIVFAASSAYSAEKQRVTVAGGPIGGTYYVLATGFAKILTEDLGLSASVEVGAGGTANIKLVNGKLADYGISLASLLNAGREGSGWAKGKKYKDAQVLFGMQLSYFHFWTLKKSGIRKLSDLNGKIVNLSKKGSGADVAGRKVIAMFGLKPAKITNVGHTQANQLMQDGLLHASLTTGGIPHPAVAALSSTHDVIQFGITGADAKRYIKANPAVVTADIPAGAYKGQTKPIPTTGDWNMMLAHKDVPVDMIYKVMKKTFANIPKWTAVHKAARTTKPENIKDLSRMPIHLGALRYYKEMGILK